MPTQEAEQKSLITISLPRSFYNQYMELHLWEEYASFSDMVRDSVREKLRTLRVRKEVRKELG